MACSKGQAVNALANWVPNYPQMCVPAEAGYEQNTNYEITASLAFEPSSPRARVLQKLEEKINHSHSAAHQPQAMSTKMFVQKEGAVGFWQSRGGLPETRKRSTLAGVCFMK